MTVVADETTRLFPSCVGSLNVFDEDFMSSLSEVAPGGVMKETLGFRFNQAGVLDSNFFMRSPKIPRLPLDTEGLESGETNTGTLNFDVLGLNEVDEWEESFIISVVSVASLPRFLAVCLTSVGHLLSAALPLPTFFLKLERGLPSLTMNGVLLPLVESRFVQFPRTSPNLLLFSEFTIV